MLHVHVRDESKRTEKMLIVSNWLRLISLDGATTIFDQFDEWSLKVELMNRTNIWSIFGCFDFILIIIFYKIFFVFPDPWQCLLHSGCVGPVDGVQKNRRSRWGSCQVLWTGTELCEIDAWPSDGHDAAKRQSREFQNVAESAGLAACQIFEP